MINELSIEDYSGLAAKLKDCLSDDNYDDDDGDDLYIIGACLSVRHKSDYFQIFSKISKFSKNFKI